MVASFVAGDRVELTSPLELILDRAPAGVNAGAAIVSGRHLEEDTVEILAIGGTSGRPVGSGIE